MNLLVDMFSRRDMEESSPDLFDKTVDAALRGLSGKERSSRKQFWEASRELLGGISVGKDHFILRADVVSNRYGIGDEQDMKDLRLMSAAVMLWMGKDPTQIALRQGIADEVSLTHLKAISGKVEEVRARSPHLLSAMAEIYSRRKASTAIVNNYLYQELEPVSGRGDESQYPMTKEVRLRAAAFSIQLGAPAQKAIDYHEVSDQSDKNLIRYIGAFQNILEGSRTAPEAISYHGVENLRHTAIIEQVSTVLDIRESLSPDVISRLNRSGAFDRNQLMALVRGDGRHKRKRFSAYRDQESRASGEELSFGNRTAVVDLTGDSPRNPVKRLRKDMSSTPVDAAPQIIHLPDDPVTQVSANRNLRESPEVYDLNAYDDLVPESVLLAQQIAGKRKRSVETPSRDDGTIDRPYDLTKADERPYKIPRGLETRIRDLREK